MKTVEYSPEKGQYLFSPVDMAEQRAALDEFQTRHSTITDRIMSTYKVGNQLLDYLEK